MFKKLFCLLALVCCAGMLDAKKYIPIVLLHGILSDSYFMKPIEEHIRTYMGDESEVHICNINLGGELTSISNMHDQVDYLHSIVANDPELQDGFNIIAHSQGGDMRWYRYGTIIPSER